MKLPPLLILATHGALFALPKSITATDTRYAISLPSSRLAGEDARVPLLVRKYGTSPSEEITAYESTVTLSDSLLL